MSLDGDLTPDSTELTVPEGHVQIRFKKTGALGSCPAPAVEFWEKRGYEAVDKKAVAELLDASKPFDPTQAGITAQKVHDYLVGIDTSTPEGQAEYDRVVKAEQAGENRKTAFPAS